jgi:hypothetical protein
MKLITPIVVLIFILVISSCNENSTNPDKVFKLPEFEKIGATNIPRQSSSLTFYDSDIFVVMNDIDHNSSGYITKSSDAGYNWDLVQSFTNNIGGFGLHKSELFMIRGASYFTSSDRGSTWNKLFEIPDVNIITSSSFGLDESIYVSTDDGIFVIKNNGTTQNQISDSIFFNSVLVHNDETLYGIDYYSNLWKADGINYHWTQITDSIAVETIYCISSNELLIGTFRNGIMKSNDGGLHWSNFGFENYQISHLSRLTENMLICRASLGDSNIDIYISTNNGESWEKLGIEKIINTYGLSPSKYLYLVESNGVVYKSKQPLF